MTPFVVQEGNLSMAWARAYVEARRRPSHEIAPLFLSFAGITGEAVEEAAHLRQALDQCLVVNDMQRVQTVANTIFPQAIWRRANGDRDALYSEYLKNLPSYVAWEPGKNARGLYFARLIGYYANHRTGDALTSVPSQLQGLGNQLEFIVENCKPGKRRSMFQATLFDPARDHTTSARLGFPCLQHISLVPDFKSGSLSLNAFYATQQVFEKAYGNLLGLARLVSFIAHESGLERASVSVLAAVEKMDRRPKPGTARDALHLAIETAPARIRRSGVSSRFSGDAPVSSTSATGSRHMLPLRPTEVFDTLWRFAAERQAIFIRRLHSEPPPWTNDPILAEYKFTNAYRASDRASQYLIRHVIYDPSRPNADEEVFFRILLFKLFNRIETWQLLESHLGPILYENFDSEKADRVLTSALDSKAPIYSAAYIMPSANVAGHTRKHRNHLSLLLRMMEDGAPAHVRRASSLQQVFELLRSYPSIGDFLAYQYAIDLNYSELTDFSEMDFVVPGPGARNGIQKCFDNTGGLNEAEIIRFVTDRQQAEFDRLGLRFSGLWGRELRLIDIQNLFCEVDKYARVYHPQARGRTIRIKIKQKYVYHSKVVKIWFPPKWGLNHRIPNQFIATLAT